MVKIDLEDMTDICGGPMTLKQVNREIHHYMNTKTPEKMVITIERDRNKETYISHYNSENIHQKYYSVIYIPNKDFEKPCR